MNPDYAVGVFMVFRDTGTGSLQLVVSKLVGTDPTTISSPARHTILRDVVVQRGWNWTVPNTGNFVSDLIVVAGSTDEPDLLQNMAVSSMGPQAVFGGTTDGFLMTMSNTPGGNAWVFPWWGTFRGGEGQDGLTGVQS
jgi:hypothetical protein